MTQSISTFQRRAAPSRRSGFLASHESEEARSASRSFAKIMFGFTTLFMVLYFMYSVDVALSPGAKSKVGCGIEGRVHYAYSGIYWRAGCAPGAPLIEF